MLERSADTLQSRRRHGVGGANPVEVAAGLHRHRPEHCPAAFEHRRRRVGPTDIEAGGSGCAGQPPVPGE
jgi:hypothetical protein